MNRIKNLCAVALLMMGMTTTASAQTDNEKTLVYPQIFFGLQGGGQTTLTNYNNWKLITPTASFSFGSFFTPVVGARLHVNGIWNKGRYCDSAEDFKYNYKYLTTDIDLMINMFTLLGKKNYYPVNLYLLGGFGLNYAWNNSDAYAHKDKLLLAYKNHRFSHNARIGLMFDCNVSKHVSLNLEVSANNLSDHFNSKQSNKGDWQITAQMGVAYKFGARHKTKEPEVTYENPTTDDLVTTNTNVAQPIQEEVWETRQDTIWYDEPVNAPKVENGTATWNVFYKIGESDFKANEQIAAIGAFLKDHRECKVDVKSYSDVKTGNPQKNLELSKQRCEKAVKALTRAGVPASSITSNFYGDTVQPFAENDKNRVSIIVATGLKDVNQKNTTRKFKTKEVRYRVK